ncbi:histidine kinase [Actinotalea sp. AC32]|nr:histidine kinase [Actinotalea sp. AC32]
MTEAHDEDRPAADPTPDELERVAEPATVRRAPRYRAFALTGAVLAVLVAVVTVIVVPRSDAATVGTGTVLAVLVVVAAALGALVGAVVAVVVERAGRAR